MSMLLRVMVHANKVGEDRAPLKVPMPCVALLRWT